MITEPDLTQPKYGGALFEQHAAKLAASGVSVEIARERSYRTVDTKAMLKSMGFGDAQQRTPALVIPLRSVWGDNAGYQIRPDDPRYIGGRAVKYETVLGQKLVIDVHPRVRPHLGDPNVPLVITEGPIKGDALVTAGACAVSLLGVWGWRGPNEAGGKVALADLEGIAWNGRHVLIAFDSDVAVKPAVAKAMARLAGMLRFRDAQVYYAYLPSGELGAKNGVDDWLVQGHTLDELWSLATDQLRQVEDDRPAPAETDSETGGAWGTDLDNARRLIANHGHEMRYCSEQKVWYVYDGARWMVDHIGQMLSWAQEIPGQLWAEVAATVDPERRKSMVKDAKASEASGRIEATIRQARQVGTTVRASDFDADPWLLNTPTGTIDLRTGQLRAHDAGDLITKITGAVYQPSADATMFGTFLEQIIPDPDERDYLQSAIGYTATGHTSEQCLFLALGNGHNGKTTLLEATKTVLGDYAMSAEPDLLLARGERNTTGIADLAGARMVLTTEIGEGRRLAEDVVKRLTGSDTITARHLYANFFSFKPSHTIWAMTNHPPIVRGTDYAIWRRLKVIPFTVRVDPDRKDGHLPEKLAAEASGILNWIIRGCIQWQTDGLVEPKAVRQAVDDYRADQDVIGQFLAERCITQPDVWAFADDLYRTYRQWAEDSGEHAITQRRFGAALTERGLERYRSGKWRWRGIAIAGPMDRTDLPSGSFPLHTRV